jgi:hypothetical protein
MIETDELIKSLLAEVAALRAELASMRESATPVPDVSGPHSYWYYRAKFDSENESARIQADRFKSDRLRAQRDKDRKPHLTRG